jgi:hypothetical protein
MIAHHSTSFDELASIVEEGPEPRTIINVLDIPLVDGIPPEYGLAAERQAINGTRRMIGATGNGFSNEDFTWALAATRGATHMRHLDANGLCTYLYVSDLKLWFVGRYKKDKNRRDRMASWEPFRQVNPSTWDPNTDEMEWEMIILGPEDRL